MRARFDHRERGNGDVVEIADTAVVRGSSVIAGEAAAAGGGFARGAGFAPLAAVPASQWRALAERAMSRTAIICPTGNWR